MQSMWKNHMWNLIDMPKDQKAIGYKWVFKRKARVSGSEYPMFKARLVVKDYSQKEEIDYHEIFVHVVKHVSFRYLLSVVAHYDMELQQMDVKTTFLHRFLDKYIDM